MSPKKTTKKKPTPTKKRTKKKTKIPKASGIPVHCSHSAIVAIDSVKPNPGNPNHHPEEQVKLLANIISGQGWRNPIVISTRSGLVVKGHCRLLAARHMGATHVPIDAQNYKSKSSEHADLIADNRIAELAEIDQSELASLIETIDISDIDMEMTGFVEGEIEALIASAAGSGVYNTPTPPPQDNSIKITVPKKCFDLVTNWLANGEELSPAGLGIGIMKRAKIRY